MAEVVAVEIGGIRIRARSLDGGLSLGLTEVAGRFSCAPDRPDVSLTVRRGTPAPVTGQLLFRSGGLWDLWEADGDLLFRFVSPALGPAPYKVARFDRELRHGRLEVNEGVPGYGPQAGALDPFEYPLDELICTHWLARGRGIELHACGIVDGAGEGRLFVGHSGAGKSTAAGLWAGPGTVLSDDRIIVRLDEGELWMYGTPWHGDARLSAPGRAPLRHVYFLEKAESVALVPLPAAAAAARLFACSFVPQYDPRAVSTSLAFIEGIVERVACRALLFDRGSALTAEGLDSAEQRGTHIDLHSRGQS